MSRTSLLATSAALTAWGVHAAYLQHRLRRSRLDPLTGLYRRDEFHRRARRMLEGSSDAVVVLLDLDGFKQINDTLGHQVGDVLLLVTADRLRAALPGAVCGRLGGDEFVVAAPDRPDLAALEQSLTRPVLHQHGVSTPAVSIGVSTGRRRDVSAALRAADAAMYAAKDTGGGVAAFDPSRHQQAHGRVLAATRGSR